MNNFYQDFVIVFDESQSLAISSSLLKNQMFQKSAGIGKFLRFILNDSSISMKVVHCGSFYVEIIFINSFTNRFSTCFVQGSEVPQRKSGPLNLRGPPIDKIISGMLGVGVGCAYHE